MISYVLIAMLAGVISSFAQVLLKLSTRITHASIAKEYLNIYVASGYALTILSLIMVVCAFKGMPFKFGAVIESFSYLYVMALSRIFFAEKISKEKIAGNALIILGVIVFMS